MGLQSWWNVDNNSADATSEGRSFHVCAATSGKARLATQLELIDKQYSLLKTQDM